MQLTPSALLCYRGLVWHEHHMLFIHYLSVRESVHWELILAERKFPAELDIEKETESGRFLWSQAVFLSPLPLDCSQDPTLQVLWFVMILHVWHASIHCDKCIFLKTMLFLVGCMTHILVSFLMHVAFHGWLQIFYLMHIACMHYLWCWMWLDWDAGLTLIRTSPTWV